MNGMFPTAQILFPAESRLKRDFGFFVSPDVILTNLKSSSILDSPKEMTFSQPYLMCFCFSILKIRPLGID